MPLLIDASLQAEELILITKDLFVQDPHIQTSNQMESTYFEKLFINKQCYFVPNNIALEKACSLLKKLPSGAYVFLSEFIEAESGATLAGALNKYTHLVLDSRMNVEQSRRIAEALMPGVALMLMRNQTDQSAEAATSALKAGSIFLLPPTHVAITDVRLGKILMQLQPRTFLEISLNTMRPTQDIICKWLPDHVGLLLPNHYYSLFAKMDNKCRAFHLLLSEKDYKDLYAIPDVKPPKATYKKQLVFSSQPLSVMSDF